MDAILNVFPTAGVTMSMVSAYTALIHHFRSCAYPDKKAAGSLGGAVNGGTLTSWQDPITKTLFYKRIR